MSVKRDELRWTPEGTAELERQQRGFFPDIELQGPALAKVVAKKFAAYVKACERGATKAKTPEGKAKAAEAAKLLKAWKPSEAKPSAARCALIATALGAKAEDADIAPYLAYVVERGGAELAIDTLEAMWALVSDHDASRGIRIDVVDPNTTSAHDASCSYGKGDIAQFLRNRGRRDPALRAAMAAHVAKRWKVASVPARAAMAYALDDGALATTMAKELMALEKTSDVYPHWGWGWLPDVIDDFALVKKLYKKLHVAPGLKDIERFGPKVLELYIPLVTASGIAAATRERMLVELANVHGPKTARIMALYVTNKPHKATTTAYLQKYPELLRDVLADPKCAEDHPYLEPLLTAS